MIDVRIIKTSVNKTFPPVCCPHLYSSQCSKSIILKNAGVVFGATLPTPLQNKTSLEICPLIFPGKKNFSIDARVETAGLSLLMCH